MFHILIGFSYALNLSALSFLGLREALLKREIFCEFAVSMTLKILFNFKDGSEIISFTPVVAFKHERLVVFLLKRHNLYTLAVSDTQGLVTVRSSERYFQSLEIRAAQDHINLSKHISSSRVTYHEGGQE